MKEYKLHRAERIAVNVLLTYAKRGVAPPLRDRDRDSVVCDVENGEENEK